MSAACLLCADEADGFTYQLPSPITVAVASLELELPADTYRLCTRCSLGASPELIGDRGLRMQPHIAAALSAQVALDDFDRPDAEQAEHHAFLEEGARAVITALTPYRVNKITRED